MNFHAALTSLSDYNWIGVLGTYVLGVTLLSSLVHFAVKRVQIALVREDKWPEGFSLVGKFFFSLQTLLISLTLLAVPPTLDMPDQAKTFFAAIGKIGTILAAMVILIKIVNVLASIYYRQLRVDQPENLKHRRLKTQVQFLEKVIAFFIGFVAIAALFFSFEEFRRFGGSLLASAGLASVILGFSAQKSIGNLIAGFQIAFTQPIRLGDAVVVEQEFGTVEEINLTYVVLKLWDQRRLILPITHFLEKPFQNWTRTSTDLIGSVTLHVDYSLPVGELRQELARLLRSTPLWDGRVENLQVIETTERAMSVRAIMSSRDSGSTFDLRCLVREKLIGFIQTRYPECLPKDRLEGGSVMENFPLRERERVRPPLDA